jgi:hypothetical protein
MAQEMHKFDPATELEVPGAQTGQTQPWLITFADLITLLLAVFVLLASVSSVEHEKMQYALRSLKSAEGFGKGRSQELVPRLSEHDAFLGPKALRDHLASRVRAIFPAARMDNVGSGTTLRFALPADAVFDGAALRPEVAPLLSAIVAAIRQGAPGFRFEVETTASRGETDGKAAGATETAIARSSALARELVVRGAPKLAVAAGLGSGNSDEILITIRARPEDEPRIDFQHVTG